MAVEQSNLQETVPTPEILSFDMIDHRHRGEWVLAEIVSYYEGTREPLQGTVLTHGPRKDVHETLSNVLKERVAETEETHPMLYIFAAGVHFPLTYTPLDSR